MKLNVYTIYKKLEKYKPTTIVNDATIQVISCEMLKYAFPPFHCDTLYIAETPEELYILPQYQPFTIVCCFPSITMYDYPQFLSVKGTWNFIFLESDPPFNDIFKLMQNTVRAYNTLSQFSHNLFQAISGKVTFQQLSDIAYEYLQNSVYIFTPAFEILAMTESPNAIPPSTIEISGKTYVDSHDMHNINYMHNHDKMKSNRNPTFISNPKLGADRILCMIDYNRDIGHFVIVEDYHPFDDFTYEFANLFRLAIMHLFSNDAFSKNAKGFNYEYFLKDLLAQKYVAPTEFHKRLKYLDNAFSQNLFCFTIETARSIGAVHLMSVRDFLERAIPSTVTIVYENQIIAIVSGYKGYTLSQEIIDKIHEYCVGNGLYCGLSNAFNNILDLYAYYNQSLRAIEIGANKEQEPGLFAYNKYHLSHTINIFLSKEDLDTFCCPQMKVLIDFDTKNETELAKTLYYYLLLGNTNDTATKLFVHRNTILYRINQINDLIHADLKDVTLRHYLMCSYEMLHPEVLC